jgi:NAD(P)-dependent dehydrogenase (short-subunit alcohol dehydrogenase family)
MASTKGVRDKRVCLFTGASGTLGTEFCKLFRERYDIAAVYHTRLPSVPSQYDKWIDPLNADDFSTDSNPVFAIKADLFDERQIERVDELTLAHFGCIDFLVNAAVHSVWAAAVDSNALIGCAARQLEMNVLVPLKLSVAIARQFWRDRPTENIAGNRNIVNISSTAGVYVYPNTQQSVYSASKAALNYLTCHLAGEFRIFGVRVNAIAPNAFPGVVQTRRVANCIHRLDKQTVSGQILIIDSGGELLFCPDQQREGTCFQNSELESPDPRPF